MILDINKDILDIIQREVDYARCVYPNSEIEIELGRYIYIEMIQQTYIPNYMVTTDYTLIDDDVYVCEYYGVPVRVNKNDPYIFKIWINIL